MDLDKDEITLEGKVSGSIFTEKEEKTEEKPEEKPAEETPEEGNKE